MFSSAVAQSKRSTGSNTKASRWSNRLTL